MSNDQTGEGTSAAGGRSRGKTIALVAGAVVAVVALIFVGRYLGGYVDDFRQWGEAQGAWGPVIFILGYAAATVAFIPGSALTLASGATFGLWEGTLYAFAGALLGATLAFLVARYVARGWVEKKLADQPKLAVIDRAVGEDGGKIVALLRLSPLFPFVLLNYALGLSKVKFSHYFWASFAMLPGTFLYVYYGAVGGAVASGGERTVWDWVSLGVGLVATVVVTAFITKKARAALDRETDVELDPDTPEDPQEATR
jgi:uncharacterized membrane protein YdjX (TVP38/TMEM64 family)